MLECTGEPVIEKGLLFTETNEYVVIDPNQASFL